MDVQKLDLDELFTKNVRYEIPLFQRRYVWDQEEQWEPLWEDVRNTVENRLQDSGYKMAHFLGAVVIQGQHQLSGRLDIRIVVDGQQRLTTMQLLLDAVQEVFEQRNYSDSAEYMKDFVLNKRTYQRGDPDKAFKVWPTMADQNAFRQTMHNHMPSDEYKESRIVRAHEFFKLRISQWLDERPEETDAKVEALEETLAHLLQLAVIDLEADEEPHVIFETLNARGTPLEQSELIKNMVMYEADRTTSLDVSLLWDFDGDWWRKEISQGRLIRSRSDAFLNYWLVMRTQREVAHNNVFSAFRSYYQSAGNSDITSVANDIQTVGNAYTKIVEKQIPEIETFLYRLESMQVGVLTPVLLWLLSSDIPSEQLQKSVNVLESFLVRRMTCGMTTNDYNRLFLGLMGELHKAGPEKAGEVILEYLKAQTAYSRLWPDDSALEYAFIQRQLYRLLTQRRLRILLNGIEEGLRTDKAETVSVQGNITIEHIMPQKWRSNWPILADAEDQDQAELDRDRLIHTIGNLTLVNPRLNSHLSNDSWGEKKKKLHDNITLFLNKDIALKTEWNEDKIKERSHELAQVAIKVWPHADGI